jgi:hypothetical protein
MNPNSLVTYYAMTCERVVTAAIIQRKDYVLLARRDGIFGRRWRGGPQSRNQHETSEKGNKSDGLHCHCMSLGVPKSVSLSAA